MIWQEELKGYPYVTGSGLCDWLRSSWPFRQVVVFSIDPESTNLEQDGVESNINRMSSVLFKRDNRII